MTEAEISSRILVALEEIAAALRPEALVGQAVSIFSVLSRYGKRQHVRIVLDRESRELTVDVADRLGSPSEWAPAVRNFPFDLSKLPAIALRVARIVQERSESSA